MTRFVITPRDRRTLLIGATLIVASFGTFRGIPALSGWQRDRIMAASELAAEARRAEASVHSLPAVRAAVAERGDRLVSLAPALLAGTSAGVAAAFAAWVAAAGEESRIQLGTARMSADTAAAGTIVSVSVRADAAGDIAALTRFLEILEGGPLLVAVREMAIAQPEPAATSDHPESLRIEITVRALALLTGTER